MPNPELTAHAALRLDVVLVLTVLDVELLQEGLVRPLRELGLLVDERDHVERLLREEVQDILIVREDDVLPVDPLASVLGLLQLEDVLHEELLQVLVRVIDAHLLEAVHAERLEPENVQHPDGLPLVGAALLVGRMEDGLVDVVHEEDEVASVDSFRECVSVVAGLLRGEGADDDLSFREGGFLSQSFCQSLLWHLEIVITSRYTIKS